MDKSKLNIIDRAISWVSPSLGVRRLQARAAIDARLNYHAATRGRRTAGWRTTSQSANAVISQDLPTLRQLARDLDRNDPLAKGAADQTMTRLIQTGIGPKPRTKNPKLNQVVSKAFQDWAKQTGYWNQQAIAVRGIIVGGESLYRKRTRRPSDTDRFGRKLRVPLTLQLMQSEYIDHNKSETTATGYIVNGIEFNGIGERIAYWLFDSHPGDNVNTAAWRGKGLFVSRRIPASEIEHGFIREEEGQVRGVPMAASVFLKHRDLDDTMDADLMRRKTAGVLGVGVETADGSADGLGIQTAESETGRILEELSPGMVHYFRPGESMKMIEPPDAPGLQEAARSTLRMMAAGWHMPYEAFTGDFSTSNYSSSRLAFIAWREYLTALQWNTVIPFVCEPVYNRFIDLLALQGEIPMSLIEDGTAYLVEWGPPKINVLDRGEEADATRGQIEDGTMTWSQAVAEEGYDPFEQVAAIAADRKMFTDANLPIPWERERPVAVAPVKESNGKTKQSAA